MNPEQLERVLSSPAAPTLPEAGVRVLALARDGASSAGALSAMIQSDADLVRDVPALLGALGVTAADTAHTLTAALCTIIARQEQRWGSAGRGGGGGGESDAAPRAVAAGAAAFRIACSAGVVSTPDALLGAMLQDIGVLAMHAALGDSYAAAYRSAAGDHRRLATIENERFQLQHADVGAMLVRRWGLPNPIVMAIKYHERPTAAPTASVALCKSVALGGLVAGVLFAPAASVPTLLARVLERAGQWFPLDSEADIRALRRPVEAALRACASLGFEVAPSREVAAALLTADRPVAVAAAPAFTVRAAPPVPVPSGDSDELTGLSDRARFDQSIVPEFEAARARSESVAIALFEAADLADIRSRLGSDAADAVMVAFSRRLSEAFQSVGSPLFRLDHSTVGLLVRRVERTPFQKLLKAARAAVAGDPIPLIAARSGAPRALPVACLIGAAHADALSAQTIEDVSELLSHAEQALANDRASRAGRVAA